VRRGKGGERDDRDDRDRREGWRNEKDRRREEEREGVTSIGWGRIGTKSKEEGQKKGKENEVRKGDRDIKL